LVAVSAPSPADFASPKSKTFTPSQINIIVPHELTPGNQPIVVTINGVASPAGAFLAVGR